VLFKTYTGSSLFIPEVNQELRIFAISSLTPIDINPEAVSDNP
jgi:hypothetical protein